MSFFDSLFFAADDVLDDVFAGNASYRAAGTSIALTRASVRSLGIAQDADRDAAASWLGYVVEDVSTGVFSRVFNSFSVA